MFELKTLLPLVLLFTTSTSIPVLEERAAATCGTTSYTAAAVNAASQKACSYYKAGSAPGYVISHLEILYYLGTWEYPLYSWSSSKALEKGTY